MISISAPCKWSYSNAQNALQLSPITRLNLGLAASHMKVFWSPQFTYIVKNLKWKSKLKLELHTSTQCTLRIFFYLQSIYHIGVSASIKISKGKHFVISWLIFCQKQHPMSPDILITAQEIFKPQENWCYLDCNAYESKWRHHTSCLLSTCSIKVPFPS